MKVTDKTLDYPLPFEYVKTVAVTRGVSQAELAALELALDGYSTTEISHQLELSAIAVRKRLGEVYRKFDITGNGPGKLAELKHQLLLKFQATAQTTPAVTVKRQPSTIDWGEAPDIPDLLGRTQELNQLQQWVIRDRTRLVTILGMAKIGKTALAVRLVQQISLDFDVVIWRSLRYAPPLDDLLGELILILSGSQTLPTTTVKSIFQLIECFRQVRCLVVLDEMETLFQEGQLAGSYREGYQVYGELLQQVGELAHSSCLMLLSREEPLEIALQAGTTQPVRVLRLQGLSETGSQTLMGGIVPRLIIQSENLERLIRHCNGHPLLLRLAVQRVQELFEGNLEQFYLHYEVLLGKFDKSVWLGEFLNLVFDKQFERLSPDERQVLNSLALLPEKPSREQLQSQIQWVGDHNKLLKTWGSLERRSFLHKAYESKEIYYILNPIIRQYIKQQIKEKIYQLLKESSQPSLNLSAILEMFGLPKVQVEEEENRDLEPHQQIGRFLSQIGYEQYIKGEFLSAKTFLNLAIEFHPNLAAAHFNLGATYEKLQDDDLAQIHYQKASESSQTARYSALSNLARLEIKKENPQAAINLIEPILSKVSEEPVLASLYKNLGWAYFQKSLYAQAENFLVKALNYDETCVAAYYLLAQVKTSQGQKQEALEYWEKGLKCPVGKAGARKPWEWPEIESWKGEARRYLQMRK